RGVVDKIASAGSEAIFLHQDVSIEESWPGIIEATERRFGRLDVMVANAGIGILCKAVEMSLTDWRRQTAVNLDGVFLSVQYAVPAMRRAGGGSIVITSSIAGLRGSAGFPGYCATKGGVRLFAKAVAMECAAEGDGIRVNTVHPGVIDTPIWTKLPTLAGSNAPIDPNEVARAGVPLGRAGQAQDIASGGLVLASDASSYMTGSGARDRRRHDGRYKTSLAPGAKSAAPAPEPQRDIPALRGPSHRSPPRQHRSSSENRAAERQDPRRCGPCRMAE